MHSNISGLDAEPENPGMFTSCSFLPKARSTVLCIEMTALIFFFF